MQSESQSPIVSQLKGMILIHQLACIRCGYELKSLSADSDCPECGEPIRLTIIDTVDPAARRLPPLESPCTIGNALVGVSLFLFFAVACAVLVLLSNTSEKLPISNFMRTFEDPIWICVSSALAFVAFLSFLPLIRLCRSGTIQEFRAGIALTGLGLLSFAVLMGASRWILLGTTEFGTIITLLFDTMLPALSLGITFTGLRRLVPRLGQRSRKFRLAQSSRQRMSDLLAALVFVVIGRTGISIAEHDSNLATLGTIMMVLCITLILVGLLYLIRNTFWIRSALCSPPPTLQELLRLNTK